MNDYSSDWIETFLTTIDPAQTQREVAFLQRQLPRDRVNRILDLGCGLGRHSGALSAAGYDVPGIDRDRTLIAQASVAHPGAQFVAMNATQILSLNQSFDAVICMWQSFGYLETAGNERLIADIAATLRSGGRFVLDIYNRHFFETRQGTLTSQRSGRHIRESKRIDGDRLRVDLVYDEDESKSDYFEWQTFTPAEISELAVVHKLHPQFICTNFDETIFASSQAPRMQIVFEKA